jgi:hypothetical protein
VKAQIVARRQLYVGKTEAQILAVVWTYRGAQILVVTVIAVAATTIIKCAVKSIEVQNKANCLIPAYLFSLLPAF